MALTRVILPLLTAFFIIAVLTACNNGVISDDAADGAFYYTKDSEASAEAVNSAFDALKNRDFEKAMSDFSKAVLYDESNDQALMGYAVLEVLNISVDPEIVSLARDCFGLANYPSNLDELFVMTYQGVNASLSSDPEDFLIQITEKVVAAVKIFILNNSGQDNNGTVMSTGLQERFQSVFDVINSISDDAQIIIPGDITRIEDNNGQLQQLVIGKAEIEIVASYLPAFRSLVKTAQAYKFILPDINLIILDFLNGEVSDFNFIQSFFSGDFFDPDDEAEKKLSDAKADIRTAIVRMTGALNDIRNRTGSAFSLSPGSALVVGQSDIDLSDIQVSDRWSDISIGSEFAETALTEINSSIAAGGGIKAYIPVAASNITDIWSWMEDVFIAGWPSANAVGIDFGSFYTFSVTVFSSVLALHDTGEPVFYKWMSDNSGFENAADIPALDGSDHFYYLKINDADLNGTLDTSMMPADDAGSAVFRIGDFGWLDAGLPRNGLWDPGETITAFNVNPNISGILDIDDWNLNGLLEDPAGHYWGAEYTSSLDLDDADLDNYADPGDRTAFRTALDEFNGSVKPVTDRPISVDDNTGSFYLALPEAMNLAVWHSLTVAGDTVSTETATYTSTGSFWLGAAALSDIFN